MTLSSKVIIFVVFMELPTWKGAYCSCCVNPLSVRLFNHAWGALLHSPQVLFFQNLDGHSTAIYMVRTSE